MPAKQFAERERERIQRVGFDASTNLSEREGKREREREVKRGRERSVGAVCEFWFSLRSYRV